MIGNLIPLGLCIKTRLSAQPLIWKWFLILIQIKLIYTRKVVHLASLWKWGFLELGSGLLNDLKRTKYPKKCFPMEEKEPRNKFNLRLALIGTTGPLSVTIFISVRKTSKWIVYTAGKAHREMCNHVHSHLKHVVQLKKSIMNETTECDGCHFSNLPKREKIHK